MKKSTRKTQTTVMAAGMAIPTTVYFEHRSRVSASIGKRGFIVRVPSRISQRDLDEKMAWATDWLTRALNEKPQLRAFHQPKSYETGQVLTVGSRLYRLDVAFNDLETHSAALADGVIYLKLSRKSASPTALTKSIKTLLSRVVGKDFLPEIRRRTNELNHLHFRKEIERISLKYNASNWGSCSTGRNVNFSTRLLFAPDDVVDYIIVHELAHLVEMNHSDRFWALVERAMPDYRAKEKWLKANNSACDF